MVEDAGNDAEVLSDPEDGERTERADDSSETVGTGSVLGIGCLIVVVLLVLLAIASRWFGVTW